ncbi:MAG: hypothetical protein JXR37_14570 [Kiritimatiellae bacterium]|nr:hypothetical protein [Kiritimatiellia bacterium]
MQTTPRRRLSTLGARRAARVLPALLALGFLVHASAEIVITNADYSLCLHESGRVAMVKLSEAEYNVWSYGNQTYADRTNMTHRLYAHFQDLFDFVILINNEDTLLGGSYGTHYSVRNDTDGLGKTLFDYTAYYGSAGALLSLVYLGKKSGLTGGPSLHEFCHRWANSLASVPTENSGHWGYAGVGGQLGGWQPGTLTNLGGGFYDADGPDGETDWCEYANGGNGIPYGELELYVMGLIGTGEVTHAIDIAQGFAWTDENAGQFSATHILTVTIADIVATDGARVPACPAAQTNFRTLTVVLDDAPLSTERWAAWDSDVYDFTLNGDDGSSLYNFWEATGGRAVMQMDGLLSALNPGFEFVSVLETDELVEYGPEGGPFGAVAQVYTLTNGSAGSLSWTTRTGVVWLDVTPGGGALGAGGWTQVTVSVNTNADGLAGGAYTGTLDFVNTSNGVATARSASLFVESFAAIPFRR